MRNNVIIFIYQLLNLRIVCISTHVFKCATSISIVIILGTEYCQCFNAFNHQT